MAWGEKYNVGCYNLSGIHWIVKFFEDGWSSSITEFKGSSVPIQYGLLNDSDDIFAPLKPTQVLVSFQILTILGLTDLYSSEDMKFWAEVYQDEESADDLYWCGWVDPKQYQEAYDVPPYEVQVTCIDGITLLSGILYDDDGTYYTGRRKISQIILDILGKIGYTEFKEYINKYEGRMSVASLDSPLDQTDLDVDLFKDMYCDEVLQKVLSTFNACIRQKDGIFCIYRPKDLAFATVYGRHFTSATVKTAISYNPTHYISRPTSLLTNLLQVPGGVKNMISPLKRIIASQDYGNKDSWIDNWEFRPETFDGTNFDSWISDADSSANICPLGDLVTGEKLGVAIASDGAFETARLSQNIGQGVININDGFVLEFEYGIYNSEVTTYSDTVQIMIMIIQQGSYYLKEIDDNTCSWTLVPSQLEVWSDDVLIAGAVLPGFEANQGWMSWKRMFIGLDTTDDIYIHLYGTVYTSLYCCYKNIKLYASSTKIVEKQIKRKLRQRIDISGGYGGEYALTLRNKYYTVKYREIEDKSTMVEFEYIKENVINGDDKNYDYSIGDVLNTSTPPSEGDTEIVNILGQFAGAIGLRVAQKRRDLVNLGCTPLGSGTCHITCNNVVGDATKSTFQSLTSVAHNFVTTYAASYLSAHIILNHAGSVLIFDSNIDGFEFVGYTTAQTISGSLHGTVDYNIPAFADSVPSISWFEDGVATRPLLKIMVDEIAAQYSEAKQFIQMPIQEIGTGISEIDALGNIQDPLNQVGGKNRVFVINRGSFDIRNCKWNLDLVEIGTVEAYIPPEDSDSTPPLLESSDASYDASSGG